VKQYEQMLPVYTARIKDAAEDMNKRLNEEKLEQAKSMEIMRERLNRAENLIFRFGTPEAVRQGPSRAFVTTPQR
jgi:hypothetical protein